MILLNGPPKISKMKFLAPDQIREFYHECLRKFPHFSIVADEVISHGKEIAVCLCFLEVDHSNFQTKPHKHEALAT